MTPKRLVEEMEASLHGEGEKTSNPILMIDIMTGYLPQSQSYLSIGQLALKD
jgi:hypothetical protein